MIRSGQDHISGGVEDIEDLLDDLGWGLEAIS